MIPYESMAGVQHSSDQHKFASRPESAPRSIAIAARPAQGLFTPPEHIIDSFSHSGHERSQSGQKGSGWQTTLPPIVVRTPPASPAFPSLTAATSYASRDEPLYPERSSADRNRSQSPLFHDAEPVLRCPAPQESTADIFPTILGVKTGPEAYAYWQACIAEVRHARSLPNPRTSTASSERDEVSRGQLNKLSNTFGIEKVRSLPRAVVKPRPVISMTPTRTLPPKRRAPKPRQYSESPQASFATADHQTKHKRAAPTKKVEDEGTDWRHLPDYSPSTATLGHGKSLKVSWKGTPIDGRGKPDADQLHEQELTIANVLRLDPSAYLAQKRKIFVARLQAIKDHRNFTKTAAQTACKMDVNKASQLWEAFDRVGWFDEEHFQQWL